MRELLNTKIVVLVSPTMAAAIEEKRWAIRMNSTSDTVREMIARGLTVELDGPLTETTMSAYKDPKRGKPAS